MPRIFHLAVALLLAATLATGACLACATPKGGSCCDPAGHCKKISRSCEQPQATVVNAGVAAPVMAECPAGFAPAAAARPLTAAVSAEWDSPPDLLALHSLLRI